MKSVIASILMAASLSTFAVDLTLSPLATAVELVRSAVGTVVSPFASTSASLAPAKEQLEAVRNDAVDFLAGAEASDVLKASIVEIKERSDEFKSMNDKQIAGLIVTALQ